MAYIGKVPAVAALTASDITDGIISKNESARFLKTIQNLKKLKSNNLMSLNIEIMGKIFRKRLEYQGLNENALISKTTK